MASVIECDELPGYKFVTINKNPRLGPFTIYRDDHAIGHRFRLNDAIDAVVRTHAQHGRWIAPMEATK